MPELFSPSFVLTLEADNYGLKPPNLKNYHIFGKLRTSAFTWYPPIRSYLSKNLSNLRFSFSSFGVFLVFSAQSSWRPIVKTLNLKVWTLPLIFFEWFHIVCHRYASKKVHFTCFNTILPLSLSSPCRTQLLPSSYFLSYTFSFYNFQGTRLCLPGRTWGGFRWIQIYVLLNEVYEPNPCNICHKVCSQNW